MPHIMTHTVPYTVRTHAACDHIRNGSRARAHARGARMRARASEESSGDFITDMVGKIFGKDVLNDPEPAGLKRMTKEDWPDQFLAVKQATAVTLASDDTKELQMIRKVLTQTQLEKLALGIAFDANVHGWSANSFHTQLDGQGAALLVGVTDDGVVFGGYNSKGWLGYGEWIDAISAFLYVFDRGSNVTKLPKVGGSGMAIIDEMGQGPQWGPDGLKISLESRSARSRLGTYYEKMPDGSANLFGGKLARGESVGLKELRVYVAIEDTELAKNYKPNVLQFQDGELENIRKNDDEGRMDGFFGKLFGGKQ